MLNIFVGVPQSKYAAIAILFSLAAVSVAVLLGKDPVPLGQKFLFIVLMFVLALPGLLMTLFQLTCIVTGAGLKNQRWWCSAYAWIGTALITLYAIVLVVVAVTSITNGTDIKKDLVAMDTFSANMAAKEYFEAVQDEKKDKMPAAGPQSYDAPPAMPAVKETFYQSPAAPMTPGGSEEEKKKLVPNTPPAMPPSMGSTPEAFTELEPFSSCGAPLM